jgi:hypothetical protein
MHWLIARAVLTPLATKVFWAEPKPPPVVSLTAW